MVFIFFTISPRGHVILGELLHYSFCVSLSIPSKSVTETPSHSGGVCGGARAHRCQFASKMGAGHVCSPTFSLQNFQSTAQNYSELPNIVVHGANCFCCLLIPQQQANDTRNCIKILLYTLFYYDNHLLSDQCSGDTVARLDAA